MVLQVSRFPWAEDPRAGFGRPGPGGRRHRLRRHRADGPPDPDPSGRPGLGADPGAVGHPRPARRPGHRASAGHPGLTGDVPRTRHHRQGRRDPGRAQQRPRFLRPRRRLVAARAPGVRPGLSARPARLDQLQVCIETIRALWAPGTKAYRGRYVQLAGDHLLPAAGRRRADHRRRLRRTAHAADRRRAGRRLQPARPIRRRAAQDRHPAPALRRGRPRPGDVAITVLDLPVIGTDREDVAIRVERLRGRTPAAAFAARHHAGRR